MSICSVTGTLRSVSGEALSGATARFDRRGLSGQDGAVVSTGVVRVTADAAGQISVDLYTGIYRLTVIPGGQGETSGQRGVTTVTVPDTASADLSELMDQTPALTPSAVTEVRVLHDEVQALYDAWVAAGGAAAADGASAYEVAVAAGFVGSEADWLASLVGPQGGAGADGADGHDGAAGADGDPGQSVSILTYTDEAAYNAAVTANAANPLVLVVLYASA